MRLIVAIYISMAPPNINPFEDIGDDDEGDDQEGTTNLGDDSHA